MKQLPIKLMSATAVVGLAGGLTALTSHPITHGGPIPPDDNHCMMEGSGTQAAPGGDGEANDAPTQLPAEVTQRALSNHDV